MGTQFTILPMAQVYNELEEKNCRAVMLLDCCYSGQASIDKDISRNIEEAFSHMFETVDSKNVAVIAACEPNDLSYTGRIETEEGDIEYNSLFTIELLKILKWRQSSMFNAASSSCDRTFSYIGRQDGYIRPMTMNGLYTEIMKNWKTGRQRPLMNEIPFDIYLIPER